MFFIIHDILFYFYLKQLIYNSTDISILLKEINRIQEILNKIKEMRQGTLGSALIRIENEVIYI